MSEELIRANIDFIWKVNYFCWLITEKLEKDYQDIDDPKVETIKTAALELSWATDELNSIHQAALEKIWNQQNAAANS